MSQNRKLLKSQVPNSSNKTFSRRDFLKLIPPALLAGYCGSRSITSAQAASTKPGIYLSGKNLADWIMDLGDAKYNRATEEPEVDISDIETAHLRNYSELRANIKRRIIMAHNINYKRMIDENATSSTSVLNYAHECAYQFRLPYLPQPIDTDKWNAQTIEGGAFVWDGASTRLDYGTAFQWNINPWGDFGAISCWNTDGGIEQWVKLGSLTPDTNWHTAKMSVNVSLGTAGLAIDGVSYTVNLSKTVKDASWGTEVAARLQAEIVSIYPEPSGLKAAHKAQFQNWRWCGTPAS